MAAELVLWENLEMSLDRPEVTSLLPLRKELGRLLDIVRAARGPVAALLNRDHIHRARPSSSHIHRDHPVNISDKVRHDLLENLSTLAYKAHDQLDHILTIHRRNRLCQDRREGNVSEVRSRLVRHVRHAIFESTQKVSLVLSLSNHFIYSKVMARRIEKFGDDMEYSVRQFMDQPGNSNLPDQREFQHRGPIEPHRQIMYGRRDDKNKILKMLLEPQRGSKTNISVICMTGSPGVGKSALAKHIYDDVKIRSYFDLRMWIPVSQITNEDEIIRGIVESCRNRRRSNYQNSKVHQIDQNPFRDLLGCRSSSITTRSLDEGTCQNLFDAYNRRLRRDLKGKHYLIILDDVCLLEWQFLGDLLAGGAPGSRILITTRSAQVANIVKREFVEAIGYQLQGLEKTYSWILFRRHASVEGAVSDEEMIQTTYEIMDICKYIPLAIKIAASFIHGKTWEEWLSFTEKLRLSPDQGENIVEHVLHLSYSDLPPRLRACFEYCSLFPEDYTFNKHDLISHWIAQGFVDPNVDPQRSLERAGELYFMELSRRCFFEGVKTDDLENIVTCKMHRIVRNLASKFTKGVAHINVKDYGMIQITDPTTKHASVNCRTDSALKLSPLVNNGSSLRTLVFVKEPECNIMMDSLTSNRLISAYRRLRVLDLHDLGMNELPDSIGDQIHLRYLDLSMNDGLTTLPKSFSRLYNLRTLKLNSCPRLQRLDVNFGLLVNLIRFEVDDCERLTCMPPGLEKLTQLETLSRFVVGETPSKETARVGLQGLSRLNMLTGQLTIQFTGDWKTNVHRCSQVLHEKTNLVDVKISWAQRTSDAQIPLQDELSAHEKTLEELKPNKALKSLYIQGYKGYDFPNWANKQFTSYLPNLVNIRIEGCCNCRYLPPFGELPYLERLTLRHMANVHFIENKAFGNQKLEQEHPFFPSLRELTLHNFYELQGWQQEVASIKKTKTRFFPSLLTLRIWNCPKLISFPSFTGVINIDLHNVNHFLLTNCTKLEPMPKNIIYTRYLQIKACLDLKDFREVRQGLDGLCSLTDLVIDSCDELTSLTYEVGQITFLRRLEISNCKLLDFSDYSETKTTGVLQREEHPWANLKSLSYLKLKELPKMAHLPNCVQHVKSLTVMWISACPILSSLPEWIKGLTALQHVRIESCQALKSLPEVLTKNRSTMKVEITECPKLQKIEFGRERKGDDWLQVQIHKSRYVR